MKKTIALFVGIFLVLCLIATCYIDTYFDNKVGAGAMGAEYMDKISTMASIYLTIALILANILLVITTKEYSDQTKKMVDHYERIRKMDIAPYFIPCGEHKLISDNEIELEFINIGNIAVGLMVHSKDYPEVKYSGDGWWYVGKNDVIKLNPFKINKIKGPNKNNLKIEIEFHYFDREDKRYKKIFVFDWDDKTFDIDYMKSFRGTITEFK